MPIEYSRREDRLIAVDDAFLSKCKRIGDEVYLISLDEIRAENALTKRDMENALKGKIPSYDDPKHEALYRARLHLRDLTPSLSARFEDGTTVKASQFEELADALSSTSTRCVGIELEFGRHGNTKFDLEVALDRYRNTQVRIHGQPPAVNHLKAMFNDLIDGAKADNSIFRNKDIWIFLSIIIFAIWVTFCISVLGSLTSDGNSGPSLFGLFMIALLGPAALLISVTKRVIEVFPSIEFVFGTQLRKVSRQRAVLFYIVTVLLIPAILTVLGVWFGQSLK